MIDVDNHGGYQATSTGYQATSAYQTEEQQNTAEDEPVVSVVCNNWMRSVKQLLSLSNQEEVDENCQHLTNKHHAIIIVTYNIKIFQSLHYTG